MKTPERPLHDHLAQVSERSAVRLGVPLPMGTHEYGGGVNFAFFSRHASRVRLEFFDLPEDSTPARVIDLDPTRNRTGDVWHVWVEGIGPGQLYAYRVGGPYQPQDGHRFNFHKLLLDPFATAISQVLNWDFGPARGYDPSAPERDMVCSMADDSGAMPKCVFTQEHFDWQEDRLLRHPWSKTVIYETHVRGLTVHPNSGVENPGTYRGLMEKIPYLKDLGVTVVELMPVQEFNENRAADIDSQTGKPLKNYWGYDPVVFFAPKASYSSSGGLGQQKLEFREMVQAFHKAGIEVILDVVFNHTAEGNELGPTLCFRGMDNAIFYTLAGDKRYYKDYTGTGNTVNANHPVVRDHILAALRYWMVEMHVDGFRFDLASVLGRDGTGKLLANAPLLERIAEDPILRDVKIIGGDEFRRTQSGNNNAYCQDNETSWYDWSCLEKHREIFRFSRGMIAFRRAHPILSEEQFYTDAEIHWFGSQGGLPNWTDPKEKRFGCLIHEDEQSALCLMFNAGADAVDFGLPPVPPGARWHLAVDSSCDAPQDLFAAGEEPLCEDPQTYHLNPRSSAIILTGRTNANGGRPR